MVCEGPSDTSVPKSANALVPMACGVLQIQMRDLRSNKKNSGIWAREIFNKDKILTNYSLL
jgi:hypothetical protein